jgi:hypothetical protein
MTVERCIECGAVATWVRHTQFAGSHPYCDKHARLEPDFNEFDSYAFWAAAEEQHSDKGYELGTQEGYEEFERKRNES